MPRSSGGRSSILVDELAHTNIPGSRHPKRYLDVEELLEQRHRRLHHRQHPAHREPERRRGADHARARARDGARLHPRPRRCRRARRPDARRPDPAPEGGQGLRPQAGRAGAQELFLARQSHGPARAGPAPHGRARRRAAARADAGPRHSRAVGRGRAHPRLRQRGSALRRRSCATPSGWPIACTRPGPRFAWRRGEACSSARSERDRVAETHAAGRAARRRGHHAARRRPAHRRRRALASRARRTSRISSSASPRARAGSRSCTARWCTTWCGAPATSASTSSPARSRASQTAREADVSRRMRRVLRSAALHRRPAGRGGRPRRRHAAAAHARRRERRSRVPDGHCRRRRALRAAGRRCWRPWRPRSATTSSSCRRSTPSPSPIRPMSRRSCCSRSLPSSSPISPRAGGRRPSRRRSACARSSRSTPSAASSPAPARSTTCCGPPPTRSPRC